VKYPLSSKLLAEGIGTFALLFVGAGAILSFESFQSTLDPGGVRLAIALAHGLTIGVMVSAMGHVSGAHFNPAVTLAMIVARKIKVEAATWYILAQLLAATLAAAALLAIYPASVWQQTDIGNPAPGSVAGVILNEGQVILVEAIATFFLVWVIFGTAVDPKGSWNAVGGFAIGLTVTLDILFAGPLTGAAMNPARSFGPTIVAFAAGSPTGTALWTNHLLYWVGPALGGLMAGGLYSGIYLRERP